MNKFYISLKSDVFNISFYFVKLVQTKENILGSISHCVSNINKFYSFKQEFV